MKRVRIRWPRTSSRPCAHCKDLHKRIPWTSVTWKKHRAYVAENQAAILELLKATE